jgi:hypothetical protein
MLQQLWEALGLFNATQQSAAAYMQVGFWGFEIWIETSGLNVR